MSKSGNQLARKSVSVKDQDAPIFDLYMSREITAATLTAGVAKNSLVLKVDSPTLPVVGDVVELKENGGSGFYQALIVTVTSTGGDEYDLNMDSLLDASYGVTDVVSIRSRDMVVNGSVAPVAFSISPAGLGGGEKWNITRMVFHLTSVSAMDDGLFGSLSSLTRGIVMRSENGITQNIFNVKNNGEFAQRTFDRDYVDKAPAGVNAVVIRRTFSGSDKNGMAIQLKASGGDAFKCIIQDDLTGLSSFHAAVQGYVVQIP